MKISKGKFVLFLIMTILFTAFSIFALVYYFGEIYRPFFSKATAEFEVPGLSEGFVPQGLAYEQNSNTFLVSGYMANGSPSRVYAISDDSVKYITLLDGETPYLEHAGGVASDGEGVWFVGDGKVNYIKLQTLLNAENGAEIEVDSTFSAPNGADFVTIYNNKLLVGEFYRSGNYERDDSHKIETTNGLNTAVTFAYTINNSAECGIDATPDYAISTTSLVQGMVVTSDKIILSTSYSLPSSTLLAYDNIIDSENYTTHTFGGFGANKDEEMELKTYILDQPTSAKTLPPMSEEITIKDDKLYILFENACSKYKMFTRLNLTNVYSYGLENL